MRRAELFSSPGAIACRCHRTTQSSPRRSLHLASPSTAPPPPALPPVDWDTWTNRDDLYDFLSAAAKLLPSISAEELASYRLLAPIGSQEVWCAGVTYMNSMMERVKESENEGDFCARRALSAELSS